MKTIGQMWSLEWRRSFYLSSFELEKIDDEQISSFLNWRKAEQRSMDHCLGKEKKIQWMNTSNLIKILQQFFFPEEKIDEILERLILLIWNFHLAQNRPWLRSVDVVNSKSIHLWLEKIQTEVEMYHRVIWILPKANSSFELESRRETK